MNEKAIQKENSFAKQTIITNYANNAFEDSSKLFQQSSLMNIQTIQDDLKQQSNNKDNFQQIKFLITHLETQLVQCRNNQALKLKDQQILERKKEQKGLEQELILTKLDLAQCKAEIDEYQYQIEEFTRLLNEEIEQSQVSFENNEEKPKRQKSFIKIPISLLTKAPIVANVKIPKFISKWNPFNKNSKLQHSQSQVISAVTIDQNIQSNDIQSIKSRVLVIEEDEETKTSSDIVSKRDPRQESLAAAVYLNYFQKSHDEQLLDKWFKNYLPILKDNDDFRQAKRLKKQIRKGIPVPLRGQVWQLLVQNKLRISSFIFQYFKDISPTQQNAQTNSLMDEDIPRTFPHLNDLFEEIRSLSSSLREILLSYQNY